jgi:hypothetical protein
MPKVGRIMLAILLWLAPCAALGATPRVTLEIVIAQGVAPTAPQQWSQALSQLGLDDVQIRSARPTDQVGIATREGATTAYHVTGVLTGRGDLALPGGRFSINDRAGLAQWIERLRAVGPEVVTSPVRLPFDLSPAMLAAAKQELARPLQMPTAGVSPVEVAAVIHRQLGSRLFITKSLHEELRATGPVADELNGLSIGTALAAALRPAGLGLAPRLRDGELSYSVIQPAADADVWPIGWPADERRRQLLPKLFDFLQVEVGGVSVAKAVEIIRERLGAPLLYDRNALARHDVDPTATPASLPAKRTSYSLALQKLLFQARLKVELRVDDGGRPFFWVTTVKPLE